MKQALLLSILLLSSTILLAQRTPSPGPNPTGRGATRDPFETVRLQSAPAPDSDIVAPFTTLHPTPASGLSSTALYQALRDRCPIARAADEAEPAAARAYSSPHLTAALRHWDSLWTLLNDPATPYAERMAAAYQGASTVTPDAVPRFASIAARRTKTVPPVQSSPCDVPSWIRIEDYAAIPAYPTTAEQRATAPFEWQLDRAIAVLNREVQAYYSEPTRRPVLLRAMEAWQPADAYEVAYRFDALLIGPRDVALLQRLIRATLAYPTTPHSPLLRALNASPTDTPEFLEQLHVAQLVLLVQTKNTSLVSDMASSILRLASLTSADNSGPKAVRSATSVLAFAHWVQRPDLSLNTRYLLLQAFVPLVNGIPFRWDANMRPDEKEIPQVLATFDTWLASHRTLLDENAAAERPHLEQFLAELNGTDNHWTLP